MLKTATQQLTEAVQLYLDLMYDCDVGKFDGVFGSTSQLHGFREGKMTCWPAAPTRRSGMSPRERTQACSSSVEDPGPRLLL